MDWLLKKAEEFLKRYRFSKRWRKALAAMMAMVVFLTTYAMILPAITLETDQTDGLGISPGEPAASVSGNSVEELAAEQPAYLDGEELIFENEELCLSLTIPAEAMVPRDSELTVREIGQPFADDGLDDEGRKAEYLTYLTAAGEGLHFTEEENEFLHINIANEPAADAPWFRFFVLSIDNADGAVQPACEIPTQIIYKNIDKAAADGLKVMCLDEDGKMVLVGSENEITEAVEPEITLLADAEEKYNASLKFTDEGTLVFGTIAADKDAIDAAIEAGKEDPEDEKTLTAVGADYTVTMTYTADAKIPEGAKLTAEEILADDTAYEGYVNDAAAALDVPEKETSRVRARFFDIKIMVGEDEIEPAAPVRVDIAYAAPQEKAEAEKVSAVHFAEEGKIPEVVEIADVTTDDKTEEVNGVSFDADSFSVYGVVYTVDFEWEVDGKTYEFELTGGGYVSLAALAAALHVTDSDIETFVADIANVEFSDPSLVWVGKAETDTTVGALKEVNGISVQYSVELTEEQIAEIDAQTVKAGDWALISVLPFETEERLTVTMSDGAAFVIKVTDAQISTRVITDDGEDFTITVTYGPEAGIPDGATLEAAEISADTEAYQYYYDQAMAAMGIEPAGDVEVVEEALTHSIKYARFFDISIMSEGRKIEPLAPVSVQIVYTGTVFEQKQDVTVVHFANKGIELIDAMIGKGEDETAVIFEQSSFSVTGTIVDAANISNGEYYIVSRQGNSWYALDSNGGHVDVTSFYDSTTGSISDYTGSNNITWEVTPSGSGYVIKAKGEDKYITLEDANNPVGNTSTVVMIHNGTSESPKNAAITKDARFSGWINYGWGGVWPYNLDYYSKALGWNNKFTVNSDNISSYRDWMGRTWFTGGGSAEAANVRFAKLSTNSNQLDSDYPNKTYNTEQLNEWLKEAMEKKPIREKSKTAGVYDYDNRIYKIDFKTKTNVLAMASDLSLAFVTDVSNSMLFPSTLTPTGQSLTTREIANANTSTLNRQNVYFTIGDANQTSTVYALFYTSNGYYKGQYLGSGSGWYALDASYFAKCASGAIDWTDDTMYSSTTTHNSSTWRVKKLDPNAAGKLHNSDTNGQKYVIYTANEEYMTAINTGNIFDMTSNGTYGTSADGSLKYTVDDSGNKVYYYNMGNRLFYLESSIASAVKDLQNIAVEYPLGGVYAALETFAGKKSNQADSEAIKSRQNYLQLGGYAANMVAANERYNNNYKTLFSDLSGITTYDGTRQDIALGDNTFFGTNGYINSGQAANTDKYVILVTDGAPNGTDVKSVIEKAEALKSAGINVITIGLSIEDVENADKMLYWSASAIDENDKIVTNPPQPANDNYDQKPSATDDKRLFYWAKNGDDLTWIMREIVRTIMKEASVSVTIKDEIAEVFYPVDQNGVPLGNNDWVTKEGLKCSSSDPNAAGKITCTDGKYTIEWIDRDASGDGWEGCIYVKAKEDFLGGNNITTNDSCTITPTKYKTTGGKQGDKEASFTSDQQIAKRETLPTACVNVDELYMTGNQTDFTVYLGTEVTPKDEIKKLWDEIKVIEVVDENGDSGSYTIKNADAMYYATDGENKATKDASRPSSNYDSIPLSHYIDDSVLDNLLTAIKTSNSVTSDPIDYAPYGQGKVGELTVTLTKTVNTEAQGKAPDTHETEEISYGTSPSERYTLQITYTPSLPDARKTVLIEAGKIVSTDDNYQHNTSRNPGKETDQANSDRSIHRIFVFAKALQITKKDESFLNNLKGAIFKLYRTARENETTDLLEIEGVDYYPVYTLDMSDSAVATTDFVETLKTGEKYYLVETQAPAGYVTLENPIPVQLTITDHYAPLPDRIPQLVKPASGLYDLTQSAVLMLTASSAHLADSTGADINGSGVTENSDSELIYYLISNNPGAALPATGGPGTTMFYLIGLALVSFAGAGILMRRKQKTA